MYSDDFSKRNAYAEVFASQTITL